MARELGVLPFIVRYWRDGHIPRTGLRQRIEALYNRLYPDGEIDAEIVKRNRRALKQEPKRKRRRRRRGGKLFISWRQKS
jgi:hypothetical protein